MSSPPLPQEEIVRETNRQVERLRDEHLSLVPHARLMEKRFYRSVARALLDHGKTLHQLELELGITLGDFASGDEELDMETIADIALYVGITIEELFRGCHCFLQQEGGVDDPGETTEK